MCCIASNFIGNPADAVFEIFCGLSVITRWIMTSLIVDEANKLKCAC